MHFSLFSVRGCHALTWSRPQPCWLPTCDVISARQSSYSVRALSGVHLPGKNTKMTSQS